MNTIESYYDEHTKIEWERLDRHPMEFAITKRAMGEYLPPPPACILDCGGGPGRYALYLAQQGYGVTLLDLSAGNLAFAREKAEEMGMALDDIIHGNALDLSRFADGAFDSVLLLGPLYHLLTEADRQQAIREALRVLRPGGRLFAGFVTIYAGFRDAVAKGYLRDYFDHPEMTRALWETQINDPGFGFTHAWFAHPGEVRPFMERCGLRTVALLGVEGIVSGHEQNIRALEPAAFQYWVDWNYRFASDSHLYGAADHLLYIGIK